MPTNQIDLTTHGYQILARLGENQEEGRATYKAIELSTNALVVIKEFKFQSTKDKEEIKRKIEVFQKLDHPGIARYITSFETKDSFYLVREYIEGKPYMEHSPFFFTAEEEIKIAYEVGSITEYLQSQTPPINSNIKVKNIFVNREKDKLKICLIDFDFFGLDEATTCEAYPENTSEIQPLSSKAELKTLALSFLRQILTAAVVSIAICGTLYLLENIARSPQIVSLIFRLTENIGLLLIGGSFSLMLQNIRYSDDWRGNANSLVFFVSVLGGIELGTKVIFL